MNRVFPRSRILPAVLALSAAVAIAGCDDNDPTGPVLTTPQNLLCTVQSPISITLTWDASSGASGYVLQRATGGSGEFSQIGGALTTTTYLDDDVEPEIRMDYRVAAFRGADTTVFSTARDCTTGFGSATITGDITTNRTLRSDTVYTLSGYVKIREGATLTIEPGTTIRGDASVPGSSLWVLRGGRLVANGEAYRPIVFTSSKAAGSRAPGDWGGIVMVGRGVINRTGATILTEGPPESAENYAGGADDNDSSGSLRYVRIEFAGFDVSAGQGQELNSLSMYAVGRGTTIEYVQALAGLDDSFEWFGGAVDGRYLVSYEAGDDHFDFAEGYVGRNQFLIAYRSRRITPAPGSGSFGSDPRGIEGDGCEPDKPGCVMPGTRLTNPVFANFTLIGAGPATGFATGENNVGMTIRRGAAGTFVNGLIARYNGMGINIRDAVTASNFDTGALTIRNILLLDIETPYDTASNRFGQQTRFAAAGHTVLPSAATGSVISSVTTGSLDFTPVAGSAALTGAGTVEAAKVTGFFGGTWQTTDFLGAAPPAGAANARWWEGWTTYAVN